MARRRYAFNQDSTGPCGGTFYNKPGSFNYSQALAETARRLMVSEGRRYGRYEYGGSAQQVVRRVAAVAASRLKVDDEGPAAPPKHILFFVIDDYGFADASYKNAMYPQAAAPPTPTIDKLAMSGVRLESYYVHSLCS